MAEDQNQDEEIRLAFRIGYLGSAFYGSQYQPDKRTVEGEILSACLRADLFEDRSKARFLLSGRTDRGVHARGQILAFTTSTPDRAIRALNGQLPPDIWVNAVSFVPASFHPRYDVISRTYRYYFSQDIGDLIGARHVASLFPGVHDFSCFARMEPGKNPVKTIISLTIHEDADSSWFEVTADSFLWHMVRCIASVILDAGAGRIDEKDLLLLLSGRCTNKMKPASPDGLILWDIVTDLKWEPVPPINRKIQFHTDAIAAHHLMAGIHRHIMP